MQTLCTEGKYKICLREKTLLSACRDIVSMRYASSSNSTIITTTTNNYNNNNNNTPYFFKYPLRDVICRCVGR